MKHRNRVIANRPYTVCVKPKQFGLLDIMALLLPINKYANHTLLDLHNTKDHAKPHLTIAKCVIDIPFKDLFLILFAFIRNHLLFCCYIYFRLPRFDSMTNFPS